jgi:hypothetical protein
VLLIILFHSCESSSEVALQNEEFVNPYEFVGEMHNEGLEFAFQKIDNTKLGTLNIQDVSVLSTSFMLSKKEYGFVIKDYDRFKKLEEMIISEIKGGYKNIDTMSLFCNGTKANKYYVKLDKIFNVKNIADTVSTFKAINKLEKEIWSADLQEREKASLLIMSSIGKHSLSYWRRNLPNYINYDSSKSARELDEVLLELLKADMIGGFLGFAAGAIIGAIEGTLIMPGVGSITAAFLSGMQSAVWGAILGSIWRLLELCVFPLMANSNPAALKSNGIVIKSDFNLLFIYQLPIQNRRL